MVNTTSNIIGYLLVIIGFIINAAAGGLLIHKVYVTDEEKYNKSHLIRALSIIQVVALVLYIFGAWVVSKYPGMNQKIEFAVTVLLSVLAGPVLLGIQEESLKDYAIALTAGSVSLLLGTIMIAMSKK